MSNHQADPVRAGRAPLDMAADEFRAAGHWLIEQLATHYESLGTRPVTRGEQAGAIRALLGGGNLPQEGAPALALLEQVVPLLRDHSLHNGHPRFFGYITSSAAPLGALADLLAAAINSNVAIWDIAPAASEIETQTVRWLAELVGFPAPCGGLMVSGGNMANFLGFMAARKSRVPWDIRQDGLYADPRRLTVYASRETHTWIEKAADVSGMGTSGIRWIGVDAGQRMRMDELEQRIKQDLDAGCLPFLVVGTAGSVSTGVVDPLPAIADICARYALWFHVDGAYGAPAAVLPEAPADLKALARADSVALDPHKWLYAPIEAACTLVRDPHALSNAFSYRPPYYHFEADSEEPGLDYYEHGLQNTRGFRALKVWLCLRHVGRAGYERMIRDDIALARRLHEALVAHEEFEAVTQHLSITTFRFRPPAAQPGNDAWRAYLDELNSRLVGALQKCGEAYVSNAVIAGQQCLRACIVNFRTRLADVEALPEIVARAGRRLDEALRPAALR